MTLLYSGVPCSFPGYSGPSLVSPAPSLVSPALSLIFPAPSFSDVPWSFPSVCVSCSFLNVPCFFSRISCSFFWISPSPSLVSEYLPGATAPSPLYPVPALLPSDPLAQMKLAGAGVWDMPGSLRLLSRRPRTEGLFCVPTVPLLRWLRVARADDVRRGAAVNVI